MGRCYQKICNGRFRGKSFNMSVAGALLMGKVMIALGLKDPELAVDDRAPHEITGILRQQIVEALDEPGFKNRVIEALQGIIIRDQLSRGTIEEDADWVIDFLSMARNPEGFASDYCAEYG